MMKDSKTVSTIRRKKGKQMMMALQKIKETPSSPVGIKEEDVITAEAEEKCYLFDDRVLGPMTLRWLMSNNSSLFLALLAIRCANALMIQTQYVPDEYWQSLEVAHNMVFGYGYLTWEWREGLRGYSYPLLFAVFFKLLYLLGLDSRIMLIKIPRLVQAVIAAWGDLCLYKLSSKLSGRATAQWTLLCQLISWFTIYCCTRTLSNSTETVLVTAALSYFPWPDHPSKPKDVYKFLALAALSVVVRPTAALIWILLCSWHLQRVYGSAAFNGTVNAYLLIGSLLFGASAVVDRVWYGRWTFVQLNFLWFNLITGGADIYGVHPWHWYFVQGFPVVMGTLILPFVVGAWRAKNKTLLWIILWVLATHSFLAHKEFRFLMPTIPLACHYCGVYFQTLCSKPPVRKFRSLKKEDKKSEPESSQEDVTGDVSAEDLEKELSEIGADVEEMSLRAEAEDIPSGSEIGESRVSEGLDKMVPEKKADDSEPKPEVLRDQHHQHNLQKAKLSVIALSLTNLIPALYFCLLHQRGTVMVTKFIYDASLKQPSSDVLFLMPCHSTPFYSYIHSNISMRFLTCEPNLLGVSNYTDEADLFYQDPRTWLHKEYMHTGQSWPAILVYFDILHKDISQTLLHAGYHPCESFFHTHFPNGRIGSYVLVSCR